jgi:hypothetical protein
MWNKAEVTAKIKICGISLAMTTYKEVTKSRYINKFVTVDLDLVKPC